MKKLGAPSCESGVVVKVEWHPGELYPRVGFIVTNLSRPAERVVGFYNQRGTAEQHIKGGKNAMKWTRLGKLNTCPILRVARPNDFRSTPKRRDLADFPGGRLAKADVPTSWVQCPYPYTTKIGPNHMRPRVTPIRRAASKRSIDMCFPSRKSTGEKTPARASSRAPWTGRSGQ